MNKNNIFLLIIFILSCYLIFDNYKIKEQVEFNKEIILDHQWRLDLRQKQVDYLNNEIYLLNRDVGREGTRNVLPSNPYSD
jgi:hypothetical protein